MSESAIRDRIKNALNKIKLRKINLIKPELIYMDVFDLNKILDDFFGCLNYLDNVNVKKLCKDIALKVVKFGCFYGYIIARLKMNVNSFLKKN